MAFEHFKNAPGRTYRITTVTGILEGIETVGHRFWITGTAEHPDLKCLTEKHVWTFRNVRYQSASDVVLAEIVAGAKVVPIRLEATAPGREIRCAVDSEHGPLDPGSWTADDPGPGSGGEP